MRAPLQVTSLVDDQHRFLAVEMLDDVFAYVVEHGIGILEARHSRCCMPCGVLPRPTPRSSSSFCTAGPTAGPAATAQLMMINGGRTPALPPVSPGRDRTVTCRIRANCASPPPSSSSEGARIENVFLGSVQVRDTQVERELLGLNGIRPPWRLRSSTRWKANTSPSVWSVVQPSPSDHRGSGWFTAPRQATGRTGKGQRRSNAVTE